mmetsp:Transcript_30073/g.75708  ORF Transcript_30073/g.75708 Transcript_30073/m.75708 type:complete len:85 (-) Transcript_30073:875-1129(-)
MFCYYGFEPNRENDSAPHPPLSGFRHLLKLTFFSQLCADIQTTDQVAADVQLGVSRPIRVLLEALANFWIREDIESGEFNLVLG